MLPSSLREPFLSNMVDPFSEPHRHPYVYSRRGGGRRRRHYMGFGEEGVDICVDFFEKDDMYIVHMGMACTLPFLLPQCDHMYTCCVVYYVTSLAVSTFCAYYCLPLPAAHCCMTYTNRDARIQQVGHHC